MSKRPVNLTLHEQILDAADYLMEKRSYSSLSTLVEELVRNEYEKRFGPIELKDAAAEYRSSGSEKASLADSPGRIGEEINYTGKRKRKPESDLSPAAPDPRTVQPAERAALHSAVQQVEQDHPANSETPSVPAHNEARRMRKRRVGDPPLKT